MAIPQIHAELIKRWADGEQIEFLDWDGNLVVTDRPAWAPGTTYRIREKSYPKTTLTDKELCAVWNKTGANQWPEQLRHVADAALKRYIQEQEK